MTKRLTPKTDYGTFRCGEKNINSKLTVEKVQLIKMLLKKGNLQRIIGETFGVSQDTISKIKRGITWSWIK